MRRRDGVHMPQPSATTTTTAAVIALLQQPRCRRNSQHAEPTLHHYDVVCFT
jgi:hypothetical protein